MCTVVIQWKPEQIFVMANRDENPQRPSTDFDYRNNSRAFYPLDVGGGSWIGVNDSGIFCAITNRDDSKFEKGRKSRGKLVTRVLECKSYEEASKFAANLDCREYNGFRLIISCPDGLGVYSGNGIDQLPEFTYLDSKFSIWNNKPGFHVISGHGIDRWDVERCKFLKDNAGKLKSTAKDLLSFHGDNTVDSAVCVHDPKEYHQTVSSCIITGQQALFGSYYQWDIESTTSPPCHDKTWNHYYFSSLKDVELGEIGYLLQVVNSIPENKDKLLGLVNMNNKSPAFIKIYNDLKSGKDLGEVIAEARTKGVLVG